MWRYNGKQTKENAVYLGGSMELIQNGTFATGEPVYQIAEKNSDGTHTTVVFAPMTKEEADTYLEFIENGGKIELDLPGTEPGHSSI